MSTVIYCRYPNNNYASEKQFFCVHKYCVDRVKDALKDVSDIEYIGYEEEYHVQRVNSEPYSATASGIQANDIWIHSITQSGSNDYYYQLLTRLKNAGFEFSSMVNKWFNDYELQKRNLSRKEETEQSKQPKFKHIRWCFKSDCPAGDCGNCNRQFSGCSSELIRVKIS